MKRIIKMLSMLILVGTLIAADTMSVSAATLKDLFDAEYYLSTYADLEAAFGDNEEALYQHFLTYGLMEGRNASPYFDIRVYREKYADLDAAFGNDWEKYAEHYLIYGLEEGRDGGGEFDAVSYAKRYPDLYEAFGYDLVQLKAHYETYGVQENRDSVSETIVEEQERIAKEAEDAQVQEQEQTPSSERVEEIFDGDGFRYIIIYDAAGNIIKASVYDAANIYYGSEVFEYDSEGNCISDCVTLADGSGFEYKYRADGGYVFVEKNSSGAVVSKEERDAYHLIYEENNGVITIDYEYVDGNKLIHKYDEGMIWRTEEYNEDSLMRVVEYYASGTKYREILFGEDGTVQEVIYNEDGTVYEEEDSSVEEPEMPGDSGDGDDSEYPIIMETVLEDGTLWKAVMYEDGSSTIYKTFTDGSNDQEERNADDEVISYIKMDVDGQILESKEYDEFGCILWKKNGVIVQRVEYVDGMKVVHSYDESGKIKYSSGFINYARYDVGIQVKYTAYFDNEKVNYEIFFDAEGNIKKEIMYNEDGSFVVTEY